MAVTVVGEHLADMVVEKTRTVADGVIVLVLTDPDGAALPRWAPGAHVDLVVLSTEVGDAVGG